MGREIGALAVLAAVQVFAGCPSPCKNCFLPLTISCTSCYPHAHKQYSTPSRCYCDSVYFPSPDIAHCVGCHPDCVGCTSPAQTSCNSCPAGSHLAGSAPSACLCDVGYPNPDAAHCSPCDLTCLTCTGLGSNACSSCRSLAVLSGSQCVCKPGYFPNPSAIYCSPCHPSCGSCQSALSTACTSCLGNGQLVGGSAPSACECMPGFYLAADGMSCVACDPSCGSCSAAGGAWCLSCKSGASLYGPAPSSCVCASGRFPNPTAGNCSPCSADCQTCSGTATGCTSCKSNAQLSAPAPSTCVCSRGFTGAASTCTACDITCDSCSGSGPAACESCKAYASLAGKACSCEFGSFPNPHAGACAACHVTCNGCSGGASTDCSGCKLHATKAGDGACVCDGGFFMQTTSGYCLPCDSSCATCTSPLFSSCSSCKSNAQLSSTAPSQCICIPGFYAFPDSGNCVPCHISCQACMDGSIQSCTQCRTNAELNGSSPSSCGCSSGFYGPPEACIPCASQCSECSSGTSSDCESCKAHASLVSTAPSSCICDTGYYLSATFNCDPCHPTCKECVDSTASGCILCQPLAFLETTMPSPCRCALGSYASPDASNCQPCHPACGTCSSGSISSCLSCKANSALQLDGSCACNAGFYGPASACVQCHASCTTCTTASENGCSRCSTHAFLVGGVPSKCECESGYFPSPNPANCVKCGVGCDRCESLALCSACGIGYFLSTPGGCIQCPEHCLSCTSDGVCSQCTSSTFLTTSGHCKLCDYCGEPLTAVVSSPYDHQYLIQFNRPLFDPLTAGNVRLTTEPQSDFNWTFTSDYENLVKVIGGPWDNSTEFLLVLTGTIRDEFGTSLATRYFQLPPPLHATIAPVSEPAANETAVVIPQGTGYTNTTVRSATKASSAAVASSVVVGGASGGGGGFASQILGKMQYFSYIGETNANMPDDSGSFYQSLNQKFWMPNFFSSEVLPARKRQLSLSSSPDFLTTAGPFLSLLVLAIGGHAILQGIAVACRPGRKWFYSVKKQLEWGLYFYLWCFVYLDIMISAMLQVRSIPTASDTRAIISVTFAVICLALCLITPVWFAWVIITNKSENPRWSFLVSPFRTQKFAHLYYPVYFVQRIGYAVFIVELVERPKLQSVFLVLPVLLMAAFVGIARPFITKSERILHTIAELDAVAVFVLLCYMTMSDSYPGSFTTWLLIGLTIKSFSCSLLLLVLSTLKSVQSWCRRKRVAVYTERPETLPDLPPVLCYRNAANPLDTFKSRETTD